MSNLDHIILFAQAQDSAWIYRRVDTVVFLPIIFALIAGLWTTFEKAGKPGWGVLIPIFNVILMLQIAGRPIWWIILLLIPVVNCVIAIIVALDIAKNFGRGVGFGLGLVFFPFIFYPILGFGDAKYLPTPQP